MGDLSRNFSTSEVQCRCGKCKGGGKISPALIEKLQKIRTIIGKPIKITSGLRCRQHPESKARPTSSHIPADLGDGEGRVGHAVDIACMTSARRYVLLYWALKAGFRRVGIGKGFIHLDNDSSKVGGVIWDYYE